MSRFARERRVFFFEEPVFDDSISEAQLRHSTCSRTGVVVLTPAVPAGTAPDHVNATLARLLDRLIQDASIAQPVTWYYTPMARDFSRHLQPLAIVYDCMDELSAFAGAPPAMKANESDLFAKADLVFTGGASLFEAKRNQHSSVHLFPSSVDVAHFRSAVNIREQPPDQRSIPEPRLGYAGVIDERMDLPLLREVAAWRPDWHFVMLGPVAKIDPLGLPKAPNIHYLGLKQYADLPAYFSGWKIGMLPFALNESTKYISPTKTPEYLAAGLRVISTPIRDVVTPYGDLGLAGIASNAREFISVANVLLKSPQDDSFTQKSDTFLSKSSWDLTWGQMDGLIEAVSHSKRQHRMRRTEANIWAEEAHV